MARGLVSACGKNAARTWRDSFCEASAWATDPESVYQCIVDAGVRIFECDGAHLHLLAVDGNSFVRHASHTDALAMADRASMLSVGVGRRKWMIRTRNPVFMDYMNPHAEDVVPKSAVDLGYKSAVSIPILAGNNLLGMYSLVYKRTLPWTEDRRRITFWTSAACWAC